MSLDIRSLYVALALNLLTTAIALPLVMGRVNAAARAGQLGAGLQAAAWGLLLASNLTPPGSALDRGLSVSAIACMAFSLAAMGHAFDLWCGRSRINWWPWGIAALTPVVYGLGYGSYTFRSGWANGWLAVQTLIVAHAVGRPAEHPVGRWRWLVLACMLLQASVTLWRGVLGAFYPEIYPRFTAPHPAGYAGALSAHVCTLLTLVGVLLAHRDEAARKLERLATFDSLTGVLNRRAWLETAADVLPSRQREGRPVSLMMLDLDHFKRINDTRGHAAGDAALRLCGRELRAELGRADPAGRHGGEEFCVLLDGHDVASAHQFDQRLRARLTRAAANELGFELSYSGGLVACRDAADTLEAMLQRADEALYLAKENGRAHTRSA